jgi:hypothetical protein
MSTEPYGVDPEILQYSALSPRSEPAAGIGLGSPREFAFKEGQPLDSTWTIQSQPGWTIEPHDGYLRFQRQNGSESDAVVSIARPFSLNLASVTVAFKLRVNSLELQDGGFAFAFAPSLVLDLTPGTGGFYKDADSDDQGRLGPSNITADGSWHRLVITIQQGVVQFWEDDQLVVTWTPVEPLGAAIQAYFGVFTRGAATSVDLSDVIVVVGSTQRARLRMAVSDKSDFEQRINYLNSLTRYIPDVQTAAKPVLDILDATRIKPGDLFWGLSVSSALQSLVEGLGQHASVSRLTTAAKTNAGISTNNAPVLYVGINMSVSFVLSGTASCGFLIGSGPDAYKLWTFALSGGGVTNVGIQGTGEIGVLWLPPREVLGFGASVQVDAGEFFQGSLGITGNMPLHMRVFDNCGPAMTWGVGVSVLPGDIAGAVSYTWNLAQF